MPSIDLDLLIQPQRLQIAAFLQQADAFSGASIRRFSKLAAQFLKVPIAYVSRINPDQPFYLNNIGFFGENTIPIQQSYCQYVLVRGEALFTRNIQTHPQLADLDSGDQSQICAYGAVPLILTSGDVIGAFCVLDTIERDWSAQEVSVLHDLAESLITDIELRLDLYSRTQSRQELTDSLRASDIKYRTFIERAHDAMSLCDEEGKIIEWNPSAVRLTGLQPEEVLGRYFWDVQFESLIPRRKNPAHYEMLRRSLTDLLRTGYAEWTKSAIEEIIARPDGEERVVAATISPIPTEKGIMISHVMRDITERKRAEKQRLQLLLEKERMKMVVKFIEKASHEFRTPLTTIYTSASLMAKQDDSERRENKLSIITGQIKRLTNLVDTLLVMLRLESRIEFKREPVLLKELLEESCNLILHRYERKPAFKLVLPEDLPPCSGSWEDLQEALIQLLDNAFRYTATDGSVTVSAGTEDQEVWIEIADTGIGIAAQDLPMVFETFWRKDDAHKTPGFGMGLSIARLVIDNHEGKIELNSQPAGGTQVRITLPLA